MNEKLQSANEEQCQRADELNNTKALLRSVRTGPRCGAVVVNQKLILTKEVVYGL